MVDTVVEVYYKTIAELHNGSVSILNYTTDFGSGWTNTTLCGEPVSLTDADMTVIRDIYDYYDPTVLFKRLSNSDVSAANRTFSFYLTFSGNPNRHIRISKLGTSNGAVVLFMFGRFQSYFVQFSQQGTNFDAISSKLMMDQYSDDYLFEIAQDKQTIDIYQHPERQHTYDAVLLYGFTTIGIDMISYIPET